MTDSVTAHRSSIDLVLATYERTTELARFLDHLAAQTYRDFRLLVVDQNRDHRLEPVLAPFQGAFPLRRLRSKRGLSRARNAALPLVDAEIVGFPDDDCWYAPGLLQRVADLFGSNPDWDGLAGRSFDELGRSSHQVLPGRRPRSVERSNVFAVAASFTMFLRSPVVGRLGPFDESLGVGAGTPWGSAEDTDYLLRAIAAGLRVRYVPSLRVGHSQVRRAGAADVIRAGGLYAQGQGRVLRKHGYPRWYLAYSCSRALAAGGLAAITGRSGRARFHAAVARGRVRGWLAPY